MRLWPFSKLETRDDSYSDTVIAAIVARAQGKTLAIPSGDGSARIVRGPRWAGVHVGGSIGAGDNRGSVDAINP